MISFQPGRPSASMSMVTEALGEISPDSELEQVKLYVMLGGGDG